eukprot:scaffold4485_cov135-Isochrysis_galbana.AAC.6
MSRAREAWARSSGSDRPVALLALRCQCIIYAPRGQRHTPDTGMQHAQHVLRITTHTTVRDKRYTPT